MSRDQIDEALYAPTRRAIQTLRAVMHQPPRSCDLCGRLLEHLAETLAENRMLYTRVRTKDRMIEELTERLAEHTNGPAANGAVVNPERKERSYEGGYHDV